MSNIKVHKSGEDLTKIEDGVKLKNDDRKIRITGAVLRIEVKPRAYSGNDYKISVWLPNHTQFECSDIGASFVQWSEFMAALVEAATGHKPRDGTERMVVDLFGFPLKVKETEDKMTKMIDVSIDPLVEDYKIVTKPEAVPSTTPALPIKTSEETEGDRIQRLNNEMGYF